MVWVSEGESPLSRHLFSLCGGLPAESPLHQSPVNHSLARKKKTQTLVSAERRISTAPVSMAFISFLVIEDWLNAISLVITPQLVCVPFCC